MKITKDGFVWKIITPDEAKCIFSSKGLPIYKLYDNDTESLIESFEEIEEMFYKDLQIGIEVGQLSKEQIYNVLYEMNKN